MFKLQEIIKRKSRGEIKHLTIDIVARIISTLITISIFYLYTRYLCPEIWNFITEIWDYITAFLLG